MTGIVLQTALISCHPNHGNGDCGLEPGKRDSQVQTLSCRASTSPAEGEVEICKRTPQEGCSASAETSQSHQTPRDPRRSHTRETFLPRSVSQTKPSLQPGAEKSEPAAALPREMSQLHLLAHWPQPLFHPLNTIQEPITAEAEQKD